MLAVPAIFMALASCDKEQAGPKPQGPAGYVPDDPDYEIYDVSPRAEQGWDIYTGTGYRYGASVIVNDDSSVDLWLAAPGGTFAEGTDTYLSEEQEAQQLGTEHVFAQYFEFGEEFVCVSLYCPSWSSSTQCFTLSMYSWDTDYDTTVGNAPLSTVRFENYKDNSWLKIYADEAQTGTVKFPAGQYLWVMSDGTETSGIWKCTDPGSNAGTNAVSYIDGVRIDEEAVIGGQTVTPGQFRSMICTVDGSTDVYWDKIVYMHSEDGGRSWSEEKASLIPTEGSRDALSCCDPGVAAWGGYYYVGYTSTENTAGRENHVYMARSAGPAGPWEKWNGSGWGGNDPQPVVTFDGARSGFGAGEPCIVVLNGTVYLYYSWNDWNTVTTRVSTAPADDPNWPARLESHGTVIDKTGTSNPDHTDVKYVERSRKFVAVYTVMRDTDDSYLQLWESEDGINFVMGGRIGGELEPGIINAGMSGDAVGHVRPDSVQYLCYAHSDAPREWGHWATWWSPLVWEKSVSGEVE